MTKVIRLIQLYIVISIFTLQANAHESGRETGLSLPRFVSFKSNEVNLRKGPGVKYATIYVYRYAGYPVQIIREFSNWRKVKDKDGVEGWLHKSLITGRRNVIVLNNKFLARKSLAYKIPKSQSLLFSSPDENSTPVARVQFNAIGKLLSCKREWCKISVYTVNKQLIKGWIRKVNIWGVTKDEQFK